MYVEKGDNVTINGGSRLYVVIAVLDDGTEVRLMDDEGNTFNAFTHYLEVI